MQNERARIARDLHDILGHSLTVVTVKAELAQRLLDVDLDRARKELGELETLARDALSDVRATALGVRGISLAGEIAAAREALAAAHVEAELPGAADEVPTRWRELFAWTIREAVTNVVRHSRATPLRGPARPARVEIVDDGVGGAPAGADGQGLPGLRRRAEALGATLTVGAARRRARIPGPGGGARMIRLLLADDQALVRGRHGRPARHGTGPQVVAEVGRGDEVLGAVRDHAVDVALLDVEMPGLDGVAAARELHAGAARLPGADGHHVRPGRATCGRRWPPGPAGSSSRTPRPGSWPTRSAGCTPGCAWSTRRWRRSRWPTATPR